MTDAPVAFMIFDVESVADGDLVARVRYPGQGLAPREAVRRYRDELLEKSGSDFIPYTFQIPAAIAVATVGRDGRLLRLVSLDEPLYRPHVMTEQFWRGWEKHLPTVVTFNGRGFDLPLLELAAYRYGLSLKKWFDLEGKTYEQPRNRYNLRAHLDLHEVLTNFGAARFQGGLNLAANLLGKPGKMEVQGHMVQDLYEAGELKKINDYCRCDVLDTYFVFLRTSVLLGRFALDEEQHLVDEAKTRLAALAAGGCDACRSYLDGWGDWQDPRPADGN